MSEKIVPDQDTAYDEVIADLKTLTHKYVREEKAKSIFLKKLEQLERLLDGEGVEEDE